VPRKPAKALDYAYKLLSYRQRSEQELKRRLRMKGYDEDEVREAVGRLQELDILDDPAFARNLRIQSEERKHFGRKGARMYLRRMGIQPGDADEALDGYNELEVARRLVERKRRLIGTLSEAANRRKIIGYLQRRGYSLTTVRKVLRSWDEED
jgi:regulatory protein